MIRNIAEKTVTILSWGLTLLLCLIVMFLMGYLLVKGLPALGRTLVFGPTDPLQALLGNARVFEGLFPAIVGTVYLILLSTLLCSKISRLDTNHQEFECCR